jgi:hypothetical protein
VSTRDLLPEDYCYPDARNERIRKLEKALVRTEVALLESNDEAARLREAREIPACRTCELRLPCPDHGEAG